MAFLIIAAVLTFFSVSISYFLTDRTFWRTIVMAIGIIGAALSLMQGYNNLERAAQLNAVVAGRQLTPDAMRQIADDLKGFAGRNLFIASYTGDAEAARLGLQIKAALQDAGILVDDNLGRVEAERGGVDFGVHISGPEGDKDFMTAMRKSLEERGKIEVSKTFAVPRVRIENNVIGIMVALRPLSETVSPVVRP
jgi:hypothetical protein